MKTIYTVDENDLYCENHIVMRQRKVECPCEGCYFYAARSRDKDCPPMCEGYKRADRLDVIFKQIIP